MTADVLIVGAGPAALILAAALSERGLTLAGLAPTAPEAPWPNTYGIWCDELEALGLSELLGHRWQDTRSYLGAAAATAPLRHRRDYGLFDKHRLHQHLLGRSKAVTWHRGKATGVSHHGDHSRVTTDGQELKARLVIDATGHRSALVERPQPPNPVAYQAAYGLVGRFSQPPVEPDQFSLMDYRCEHLSGSAEPPTFLNAMDLGNDIYFVEETSLALAPAVSFDTLKERLEQRLAYDGVSVKEIHHTEHCLFPMNQPLPDLNQPVLGFGGAASMVHPATGYMVGAMLRRSGELADAIALALDQPHASPETLARAGWQTLWSTERVRKHHIYQFGLEVLMRFNHRQLCQFFESFFKLPRSQWAGFLADGLTPPELVWAMITMFSQTTNPVRGGLMAGVGTDAQLLIKSLMGAA